MGSPSTRTAATRSNRSRSRNSPRFTAKAERFSSGRSSAIRNPACASDEIIRVSRQNNSGTYVYFREALLGTSRELKLGSIDQSGSKDVVVLVSRTPCAIGYSGMAYVIPEVKRLKLSRKKGEPRVVPSSRDGHRRDLSAGPAALPLHPRDAERRRPGVHRLGAGRRGPEDRRGHRLRAGQHAANRLDGTGA